MASVDGARPTDKPSDTASNVKCEPCGYSGFVKKASAYCQQCEEHMCVECASIHKGFKQSRNHSIIFGSDFPLAEQTGVKKVDRTEIVGVDLPDTASEGVPPASVRTSWSDLESVSSIEVKVPCNYVTGSAVFPDGRLILSDHFNKQMLLLDLHFNILSTLTMPGSPYDLAVYGDNAAVVTMPDMKQLMYIHVDTTLRAGRTIQTGRWCGGVAVHEGLIYVTVKDSQYGDHVQVLDTDGNVTRRIGVDVQGTCRRSIYQNYITVGTGGTVYISDYGSGHITCYTNAGDVVYDVKHDGMSVPQGMSVDEEGNLLVCCRKSNTIQVLGKDGAHHKVLLSSADGLVRPKSVSYRSSDHTLIVTMYNNPRFRAYTLK